MSFNKNKPLLEENIIELLNRSISEGDILPTESDDESYSDIDMNSNCSMDVSGIDTLPDLDNANEIEDEDMLVSEDVVQHETRRPTEQISDSDVSDAEEDSSVYRNGGTVPAVPSVVGRGRQRQSSRADWNRQWLDVTYIDPGPVSTIPLCNINHGPNLPSSFDTNTKPIEYFNLFFDNDLIGKICTETNLYANAKKVENISPKSRFHKWENITETELRAALGVVLNMGLHPLPDIKDYFSVKWVNRMPFFPDVFSRDRFLMIFWNLHFSHIEGTDRDLKIRDVVSHIKEKCQLFYNPSSNVSVDESTVSFKGKIVFRVYNPNKPNKFGIKIFVLSDSMNGYIFNFDPYYGKEPQIDDDLLKTTKTVVQLCKTLTKDPSNSPSGYHVYVDRYYNSPQLAQELLKLKMYVTGTVLSNRKEMPTLSKKLTTGEIEGRRKDEMAVVFWKDKRLVTVLTTNHLVDKAHMVQVQSKYPNAPPVLKPQAVVTYTTNMGGVDRSDHFISNYQFMRKCKKWYRKVFFWLLEVATVDAYLLYKMLQEENNKTPMSHKQFRLSLIEDLVRVQVTSTVQHEKRRRGRPKENVFQRLDGRLHLLGKREKGSRKCLVCTKKKLRKETVYFCKTCPDQPFLHPDICFEVYHTEHDYF